MSRPWIKTIPENAADGPVRRLYEAGIQRAGKVFNIVKIMSLQPEQLEASMNFYRILMFGPSGLSRAERELLATVVSATNRCFY